MSSAGCAVRMLRLSAVAGHPRDDHPSRPPRVSARTALGMSTSSACCHPPSEHWNTRSMGVARAGVPCHVNALRYRPSALAILMLFVALGVYTAGRKEASQTPGGGTPITPGQPLPGLKQEVPASSARQERENFRDFLHAWLPDLGSPLGLEKTNHGSGKSAHGQRKCANWRSFRTTWFCLSRSFRAHLHHVLAGVSPR
jgi:hypothetical protein